MTEETPPPTRPETPDSGPVADRRAREAARLRENLRRRKEQARARQANPTSDEKRDTRNDET